MKAIDRPFSQIITGNNQFIIPVFQRDYTWTDEQCRQLWNDVLRASQEDSGGHFMGSFVYVEGSPGAGFSSWMLIDGQQRLTTLTLLLTALRDHIRETHWIGDDPTPERIEAYFLKNILEPGDRKFKLVLRRHDNDTLHSLIDGGIGQIVGEYSSELVLAAYRYFRERLDLESADPRNIYKGIANLSIVDVKLEPQSDNPQLVFESLNSTGVDLTQSDLIRNYLLMGLPEPDQTRLYNLYWSAIEGDFRKAGGGHDSFLRDFIALRRKSTTQVRADKIYLEFKDFWPTQGAEETTSLLEDMARFAHFYASFLRPSIIEENSIANAMANVRSGPVGNTHASLVMRLYDLYDRNLLTETEFAEALSLIKSYLIRRAVLGLQTRDYWTVFMRISLSVEEERPLQSLRVAFATQGNNYRFPEDSDFSKGIQERNLYELRVCRNILDCLENHGQQEVSPVSSYSIEHIMPQSIDEVDEWKQMLGIDWADIHRSWLHRLGNLTLTGFNSSYSNRPFEEKKSIPGGFGDSAVRLNKYVREQNKWTVIEMEERSQSLSERAIEIWPHHKADQSLILNREIEELKSRAALSTSESLNISDSARTLLSIAQEKIREFGDTIEVVENRSMCYYDGHANFFAEVLPMSTYIRFLLPIDFDEVEDPLAISWNATLLKSLPNATHKDCGVGIDITSEQNIEPAVAIARQAFGIVASL